jgi:hypothetical protein
LAGRAGEFAKAGWLLSVEHGTQYRWFLAGFPTAEGATDALRSHLDIGAGNRRIRIEKPLAPEELAGHKLRLGQVIEYGFLKPKAS